MHWTAGHRRGLPRLLGFALVAGKHAVMDFVFDHSHTVPVSGCWLWMGTTNKAGYGYIVDPREPMNRASPARLMVHRLVCETAHGKPHAPDLLVRHSCDTPTCVNPAHLSWGTHQDNSDDKVSRGRLKPVTGMNNPRARITDADATEIRALRADGWTNPQIAARYGVGTSTVSRVHNGNHWTAA